MSTRKAQRIREAIEYARRIQFPPDPKLFRNTTDLQLGVWKRIHNVGRI